MAARKASTSQDEDNVRLALVPDASYASGYVSRKFAGGRTEFELYEFALQNHFNVLLEGPTGVAKTTSVLAYAAKRKLPFYSVSSSAGTEPSQLFGKYIPDGAGGFIWQDGPVTHLFRHGGVLLLNEVNFIPTRVASVLFSALDRRREIQLIDHKGEVIVAHNDLLIVADMNPDYYGTQALNAAFRNRFKIQLAWDYDPKIESRLFKSKELAKIAAKLRVSHRQGELDTPISTNMLIEFEEITLGLGLDFARENFANHFKVDEREAIVQTFNTFEQNLITDYERIGKKSGKTSQQPGFVFEESEDVEEIEFDDLLAMTLEQITAFAVEQCEVNPAELEGKDVKGIADFLLELTEDVE
jgi:hypothetical protein